MKLNAAFRDRCERIAVDWRYDTGKRPTEPLPANIVLERLQIEVKPLECIPHITPQQVTILMQATDWFGALIPDLPPYIVVHPDQSAARLQSTLMHEIAHILLKHPYIGFDANGLPLRDNRCELEATHLGGCLQLPRLAVYWAAANNLTIGECANFFGASVEMVHYRANLTLPPEVRKKWLQK